MGAFIEFGRWGRSVAGMSLKQLVPVSLAVLAAVAAGTAIATPSGAVQLNSRLAGKWTGATECPRGTPSTFACYGFFGNGVVPGLGRATTRYIKTFNGNFDAPCVHTLSDGVIQVAGKGALELSITGPRCEGVPPAQSSMDARITGGSKAYSGATGSLRVNSTVRESGPGTGTMVDIWSGTVTVPGLEFDLTAPTLKGATSRTVRAPRDSKRLRVRYAVTARDAVDGSVPVVCIPRTSSFFRVGKTKVNCSATDTSGNTRRARFTVTVS